MAPPAKDWIELRDLLRPDVNEKGIDKLLELLPAVPATDLATRHDLAELRGEILAEIGAVRAEIGAVRAEIGAVRGEIGSVRGEIGSVRAEIERSTKSIVKWMAGLVFPALVAGIGASTAITAAVVG